MGNRGAGRGAGMPARRQGGTGGRAWVSSMMRGPDLGPDGELRVVSPKSMAPTPQRCPPRKGYGQISKQVTMDARIKPARKGKDQDIRSHDGRNLDMRPEESGSLRGRFTAGA